jgi:hypothetical protein
VKPLARWLTGLFVLLALIALAAHVVLAAVLRPSPTPGHEKYGALALIFVGTAYCILQGIVAGSGAERLKGLFLGLAFILWGSEPFLPSGPLATAVDTCVIAVFVLDLSLIAAGRLRRPPR